MNYTETKCLIQLDCKKNRQTGFAPAEAPLSSVSNCSSVHNKKTQSKAKQIKMEKEQRKFCMQPPPVCVLRCLCSSSLLVNLLPQKIQLQTKGRSPVCQRRWALRWDVLPYTLPQPSMWQMCCFFLDGSPLFLERTRWSPANPAKLGKTFELFSDYNNVFFFFFFFFLSACCSFWCEVLSSRSWNLSLWDCKLHSVLAICARRTCPSTARGVGVFR